MGGIPSVGFGTFKIPATETQAAVEKALEAGYVHIDTAAGYYNEAGVGNALRAQGAVSSTFVTTKLRNYQQGYDNTLRGFEDSFNELGIGKIDLFLIHWPAPSMDAYVETWKALVKLKEDGAVGMIGVSNFMVEHLERIINATGVVPDVNQIECHPSYSQPELVRYCKNHGIVVEACAPLGQGNDMRTKAVVEAAEKHDVTPAQVLLRWNIQHGNVVIPKSVHFKRMKSNLDLFGFELSAEEMLALDEMNDSQARMLADPYSFDKPMSVEDLKARGLM